MSRFGWSLKLFENKCKWSLSYFPETFFEQISEEAGESPKVSQVKYLLSLSFVRGWTNGLNELVEWMGWMNGLKACMRNEWLKKEAANELLIAWMLLFKQFSWDFMWQPLWQLNGSRSSTRLHHQQQQQQHFITYNNTNNCNKFQQMQQQERMQSYGRNATRDVLG